MKNKTYILIVDDDTAVCMSLRLLFERAGYEVSCAFGAREARQSLQRRKPDLVILDMNFTVDTTGKEGLKMLAHFQEVDRSIPVILITGWGSLQLAVNGMKAGARDFITKPWDNKELLNAVSTALELSRPKSESGERLVGFAHIIGQDHDFVEVLKTARQVSRTTASVLILGESGTGKELLAEAIHYESQRSDQPFVKVNLGGISTTLFESEMFGHKKGAYTGAVADRLGRFALADKGTIFLDEIGDLDASSQVKLLRVLQEKTFEVLGSSKSQKVDVRVISATNKNLEEMVTTGSFREDLYYRINLITLTLPSLKERRADIPLLAQHYIDNLKTIYERPELKVSKRALNWLEEQNFPGNIRQLRNLVERTVLVTASDTLDKDDFIAHFTSLPTVSGNLKLPEVGEVSLDEMDKLMVEKAMKYYQGNISRAAQSLGITRSALYRRLAKYNIPHEN